MASAQVPGGTDNSSASIYQCCLLPTVGSPLHAEPYFSVQLQLSKDPVQQKLNQDPCLLSRKTVRKERSKTDLVPDLVVDSPDHGRRLEVDDH